MPPTGILAAIGNTPLVRLSRLVGDDTAEVWIKLEAANPTGSYKDRMALAMIEGAERDGRLQPGQTVVEYTGGSTGSSLALVCAVKDYPLRIVTSDAFAEEKLKTMLVFGAELDVIPSPDGITPSLIPAMRARAAEIAAEIGGFQTDQFNNLDMVDGYRRMGQEIADQLEPDALCIYVGTAGCFVGVGRAVRERYPAVRRIAVEPGESSVLSGRAAAPARRRPRRRHRGLHGRGLRHGPPGVPDRGPAFRAVHRCQRGCRPRDGSPPGPRPSGRHRPGRQRAQVPDRTGVRGLLALR